MNTTWKKITYGFVALTFIAIGTVSATYSKTTTVFAETFSPNLKIQGNLNRLAIPRFQLMPESFRKGNLALGEDFSLFPATLPVLGSNFNVVFRQLGESMMDSINVDRNAAFDKLLVGFNSVTSETSEAALQVDGIIKIESLADATKTEAEEVCVNDFGVFERCGGGV